ncbi:MAG: hypothetical protein JNM21_10995 [Taibaiella sp.]|nr:hypothetical protein [Taibaiella sp.]
MTLLLDIDGVLETSPAWKTPRLLEDGFYQFNVEAQENLKAIIAQFQPEIILTTTHRVNYTLEQWRQIFQARGMNIAKISKINDAGNSTELRKRNQEIEAWFYKNTGIDFLILDDDTSLYELPLVIKERWIRIDPLLGITREIKQEIMKKFSPSKT